MKIHIAHSPDADDAFMFYALLQGKIDRGPYEIVDVQEDIQSLNEKALTGTYEFSAVSFHAFPYISERYRLLSTGACFGDQYGPVVVTSKALKPRQLLKVRMAIPGKMTTAFLALKLYEHALTGEGKPGICYSEVPFDEILEQVAAGKIEAGLIIHEGQLSFQEKGLHKIVDLGEWWHKQTGLPLPLGGIAVRRDLEEQVQKDVAKLIQKSIQYALEHKEEALAYALPFARGLDAERTSQFIGWYVNDYTVDMGRKGLKALKTLFERGWREGILKREVDFEDSFLDIRETKPMSAPESLPPEAELDSHQ